MSHENQNGLAAELICRIVNETEDADAVLRVLEDVVLGVLGLGLGADGEPRLAIELLNAMTASVIERLKA